MNVLDAARQLLDLYPRIFLVCHTRHVRDPKTRRLLSAHQASILDHLDDVEPTSLSDLAAHSGVTASTMSLSVDRLVRAGYVLRVRDTADGRRVRIRFSPAGVRIKQAHSVLDARRVRSLLARLAPVERAEALRGLAMLADAARLEMHAKVLDRLRPGGRSRVSPSGTKGESRAQVDDHRSGSIGSASRTRRDHRGHVAPRSRRVGDGSS